MTDKPLTALHKAARDYASAGIPVFPIQPNGKAPASQNSFENATTDLCQIDAWWNAGDFNIGLEPERMGWAVVDVDEGGDKSTLPDTFTVVTPSGGSHHYYAGSIGASVRKLGPGLDTRGRRSYVLLPPSVVYGNAYTAPFFPPDDYDLAPLPDWIAAAANTTTEKRQAPDDVELDKPLAIDEAKRYLARTDAPAEGNGSDDATYRAAARLKDYGISEGVAAVLLERWSGFDAEWIEDKIANVYHYGQNELGSDVPKSGQEEWGKVVDTLHRDRIANSRFQIRRPQEYVDMPELEFWDDDKTLPKFPDGAVLILYGAWGSHKTNTTLTMLLDAVSKGARVIYAAGEGAYGVGKDRLPAHCASRGMALTDLDDRFGIVPGVPLFASGSDVAEFTDALAGFKPNIIVLDTLATAIAGEDENSSRVASFLTANGPAGRIRDTYKALVILLAHEGKVSDKGLRGHSGQEGNVDAMLRIEAHDSGGIELNVRKMRDGRDGFSIYFQVPPKGSHGVPVPTRIDEEGFVQLTGNGATGDGLGQRIAGLLRDRGCFGFAKGLDDQAMAEALVEFMEGSRPAEPDAKWTTALLKQKKGLQNAGQRKKWAASLCGTQALPGGSVLIRRWFLPEGEVK